MHTKIRSFGNKANYGFQIVAVGALTGAFAGLTVTLFNTVLTIVEEFAQHTYGVLRAHPAFLPLLFLTLFVGSIVIGGVLRLLPILRGSGFAQTEGAARGLLRYKWYEALTGMFASALFLALMGFSAGGEGPSIMIGGACGEGVSALLRRNAVVKRYQITGGACAGLAVALNAPLTGIVFAYEETHKRFTPEVFVCSFSSVVVAIVIRNLLRPAMGLEVGPFLSAFTLPADAALGFVGYVLLASVAVALIGVAFYFLLFALRKGFAALNRKFKFAHGCAGYVVAFALAGTFGLLSVYSMGSGVSLIEGLAAGAERTPDVFGASLVLSLVLILFFRFLAAAANMGTDLPCCSSVPMMAMGAVIGKLMSLAFVPMGMDPALSDALVVVCMVTFFTTVVKSPLTGIVMAVELTWSFTFLLPVAAGVAVGYVVGDLFRTEPVYDRLLDEMLEERKRRLKKIVTHVRVGGNAAGRAIRDILWPYTALVTGVRRGEATLTPSGLTELAEGDLLTVEGSPEDEKEYLAELVTAAGEIVPEEAEDAPLAPETQKAPEKDGEE